MLKTQTVAAAEIAGANKQLNIHVKKGIRKSTEIWSKLDNFTIEHVSSSDAGEQVCRSSPGVGPSTC